MKPLITIHNAETNEIVEREMTDSEFAEYEKAIKLEAEIASKQEAETELKNRKRDELLTKLGITADEAKLLLG